MGSPPRLGACRPSTPAVPRLTGPPSNLGASPHACAHGEPRPAPPLPSPPPPVTPPCPPSWRWASPAPPAGSVGADPCPAGAAMTAAMTAAGVWRLEADVPFRGGVHAVRVAAGGGQLDVEVEERRTADTWRGRFDAAFVEDLTHKTGNFKQFEIFCSMLESALSQSSEAVSLDLLTYDDLEALRSRKAGAGPRPAPPPAAAAAQLRAKRYLILVYSVEFDRIHYPLPLPYTGKPDPAALRQAVRQLQAEVARLRAQPGSGSGRDPRDAEIRQLRDELAEARAERGGSTEVAALRRLARGLEAELLRERTRHQRATAQRLHEAQQLASQLAEAKAAERSLRLRVKSLTNELALYKRGRLTPPGPGPPSRAMAPARGSTGRPGGRSSSGERGRGAPPRHRSSSGESRGSRPRQSPSPTGARPPRFDPTAFVRAKERKQQEAELRAQRQVRCGTGALPPSWGRARSRGPPADGPGRTRGRSSSESFRSQRSSASSLSSADELSEPAPPRGRRRGGRGRKPLSSASWNSPDPGARGHRKYLVSSPVPGRRAGKENCSAEPPADLAEIDARLQALQDYMSALETRT
ncbi:centrosomal protein CCDC61 isoform X2 [Alligator mississippiensis]|uniref:centrosomal protein CCDC61 isoform X2 n=1 Tax=Alligator mississippiensis TaxID=8496 RepID=UPI002877C740|nr:centrosomal protein CCDC61 isoform X2 [Alligator mississippiensis]